MKSQELVQQLEVTEKVTIPGILMTYPKITPAAINATATATVAEILSGYITSTSAAAVALTTPTALALATAVNAAKYSYFDITIDNISGSNTVTFTGGSNVTMPATATILAGDAKIFRILFTSVTVTSGAISAATVQVLTVADQL